MTTRTSNTLAAVGAAIAIGTAGPQAVRLTPEYRHAMREYAAAHPTCEHAYNTNVLHSVRVAVHHIEPVSWNWQRACDTNNMITLCDPTNRREGCHFICGHDRSWMRSSPNPRLCWRLP